MYFSEELNLKTKALWIIPTYILSFLWTLNYVRFHQIDSALLVYFFSRSSFSFIKALCLWNIPPPQHIQTHQIFNSSFGAKLDSSKNIDHIHILWPFGSIRWRSKHLFNAFCNIVFTCWLLFILMIHKLSKYVLSFLLKCVSEMELFLTSHETKFLLGNRKVYNCNVLSARCIF